MNITIELAGGAELLFDNKKKHEVELAEGPWTMATLLPYIRDNMLQVTYFLPAFYLLLFVIS